MHQAYVKPDTGGDLEYCLVLDKQINKKVKACSELVSVTAIKEPDYFIDALDTLIAKPTAVEKRKIKKLKIQIEKLRAWGKQVNKPRMIKQKR